MFGSGLIRVGTGLDGDEPRTIAIGARAALLKRPIIWEQRLYPLSSLTFSEKHLAGEDDLCWDHLQVRIFAWVSFMSICSLYPSFFYAIRTRYYVAYELFPSLVPSADSIAAINAAHNCTVPKTTNT